MWTILICSPEVIYTSMEPPSQVGSFTELSKQAQVTAGRLGKVVNPCGHGLLTLEIINSQQFLYWQ